MHIEVRAVGHSNPKLYHCWRNTFHFFSFFLHFLKHHFNNFYLSSFLSPTAAVAGVFTYTKGTVEEIRGGEDVTSSLVAGCVAGSLAGFPTKSILVGAGSCALMSAFAGAVYGIGSLQPEKQTSMQYIDRIKEKNREAEN